MCNVQLLDVRNAAQTRDLAVHILKAACGGKLAQPAVGVLTGHIVVGVVACHHHQRAQDDFGVTGSFHSLDDGLAGGLLRLALHRANEHVVVAQGLHGGLHLTVTHLSGVGGAVTHKDESGFIGSGSGGAVVTGILHSGSGNGLGNSFLICVDDGSICAHLAQQGLGHSNALKLVAVLVQHLVHLVVLCTVHQMGGLHDQVLHVVCHSAVQCLLHIVDLLAVACLHMVDDDLCGKGAAHAPVGVGSLQGILNALDVGSAAVVEGGAEGHHQQLVLTDLIGVAGIVLGFAVLIILLIARRSHTTLRRKDTEIRYRDVLFQKLSLNVDDVFLMLDAETSKVDYVSPNIGRLLGIPWRNVRQDVHALVALYPKDDPDRDKNFLEGLHRGEQREWDAAYLHQETREPRWFHIVAMGSEVEGKTKYILVMSDRTADKQVNQALSDAVAAAETANRAKSTFLSNMSHDIRTPMNAIIGFTTLAISNLDDQERVKDYLTKTLASSNHLLSLINDVLDMSRIESGKIHLEEVEVNLSDVLHDLKTIVSGQVHAKQLELYMDAMDVTDEDVSCDKTRLNQILLNLLSNAIKFTPAGGTVSVRVRQLAGQARGCGQYEFRIKDNGIGMSPEFAKRIFEPFERERTSTVSRIQGTGLGMAITKNIVDMMGGTIEVQTAQGKGSEFIVRVPLRVQAEHRPVEKITELEGLKALVVDDDFNTCDSVTKMLVQVGMRAEWTLSGKEAVLRARQSIEMSDVYHAYLIDWRLPDMNGIEVTRQIRSLHDDTPIIILTAYDWSDIEVEAKAAGVTAFCSKPMFLSDLRETLMSALGQKQTDAAQELLPPKDADFKGRQILLVEDNELNREIAQEILREYGFRVDPAENGAVAVEKVSTAAPGSYDLVLMDVQMPVMDGYTATRQIRALENPALAGVPILAMTANAFDEDRRRAMESGMNGFLSKPIVIGDLVQELHKIL